MRGQTTCECARLIRLRVLNGEPGGTRTRDPLIKSQMLYRLSYRPDGWEKRNDSEDRIAWREGRSPLLHSTAQSPHTVSCEGLDPREQDDSRGTGDEPLMTTHVTGVNQQGSRRPEERNAESREPTSANDCAPRLDGCNGVHSGLAPDKRAGGVAASNFPPSTSSGSRSNRSSRRPRHSPGLDA